MQARVKTPHPKVLPYFCLTEMWERFGFYIVQGLLVLYMTQYFGFTDSQSYSILGIYTALAYTAPLIGGYLASRVLGYETTIVWGGFFLIAGYAMLALPFTKTLLYPALATIVVGTGLFKPNISSLLGTQYARHDIRRDSGFTIFYIGINFGIFLAGISSGYIKQYLGWRVSFGLASGGLCLGLLTFVYGLRYLINPQKTKFTTRAFKFKLFICCLLSIVALNFLLKVSILSDWLMPCVGIVLLVYLSVLTFQQKEPYFEKMIILNILIISSVVFWMLYLQQFYSAMLYIDRIVDKTLFGVPLSPTVFYASQSVFIILLGPLFALGWDYLGHRDKNPAPISKFVLGIIVSGVAFLILGSSTFFLDNAGLVSPFWIFATYFMITIGELLLSPVGLSAVTMLAPPHLTGIMMGVWFVALGFGGIFAGWIAKLSSIPEGMENIADMLPIYRHAFFDYAYIALFMAIILYLVQTVLMKYIKN